MPSAAPKPCAHIGCGKLVRDGRYCSAHQGDKKQGRFADSQRGSRHERGYGTAWDKLRLVILARDNGLCVLCHEAGRLTPAAQVDHIIPKAEGGTDQESNLQSVCVPCHRAKTDREKLRGRGG